MKIIQFYWQKGRASCFCLLLYSYFNLIYIVMREIHDNMLSFLKMVAVLSHFLRSRKKRRLFALDMRETLMFYWEQFQLWTGLKKPLIEEEPVIILPPVGYTSINACIMGGLFPDTLSCSRHLQGLH